LLIGGPHLSGHHQDQERRPRSASSQSLTRIEQVPKIADLPRKARILVDHRLGDPAITTLSQTELDRQLAGRAARG